MANEEVNPDNKKARIHIHAFKKSNKIKFLKN